MAKPQFASVTEYIASQPKNTQPKLKRAREVIRRALPGAEEVISYQIPTYKLEGRPIIYFAGWKEHLSIYPITAGVIRGLKEELSSYEVEKGTVRIPWSDRLPVHLISRITQARAVETLEKKRTAPKKKKGKARAASK